MTGAHLKTYRWGIIGLGKIAHKMAHDLALVPSAKLLAVASRSMAKAVAFAEEHKAEKAYDSYEALCADPELDIIYIATPHSFHFEHASLGIEAGKAVLVEKPMGLNLQQSEALVAKAQAQHTFLMEGIWTRFIPITERYLDSLNGGEWGEITKLKADFGFKPAFDPQKRLFNPQLGGGSLLDIGIYPLYWALISLGMPNRIDLDYRLAETGVDVYCKIHLQYSDAEAELLSSFEENTPTEARISTEKAEIKIHSRFHHSAKMSIEQAGSQETIELPFKGLGYVHEIEEVHRCLSLGLKESPKLPLKTSLQLAELLEKVASQMKAS
jgi:predicted dehydrogenase